jgi:regulator of replication initiation timing
MERLSVLREERRSAAVDALQSVEDKLRQLIADREHVSSQILANRQLYEEACSMAWAYEGIKQAYQYHPGFDEESNEVARIRDAADQDVYRMKDRLNELDEEEKRLTYQAEALKRFLKQ